MNKGFNTGGTFKNAGSLKIKGDSVTIGKNLENTGDIVVGEEDIEEEFAEIRAKIEALNEKKDDTNDLPTT